MFQVFAIDDDDCNIYFRSGIEKEEFSGRYWRVVDLPFQVLPVTTLLNESLDADRDSLDCESLQSLDSDVSLSESVTCTGLKEQLTQTPNLSAEPVNVPDKGCDSSAASLEYGTNQNQTVPVTELIAENSPVNSSTNLSQSDQSECDPKCSESDSNANTKVPFGRIKTGLNSLRNRNAKFVVDRIRKANPKSVITEIGKDLKDTRSLVVQQAKDVWFGKYPAQKEESVKISYSNQATHEDSTGLVVSEVEQVQQPDIPLSPDGDEGMSLV